MNETIRNLAFSGAAFPAETSLPIFPSEKDRLSIIYGRNGSGKSTIAKAVLKLSGKEIPELLRAEFLDAAGTRIIIPNEEATKRIFVFDEEYVQEKVRLKEDGLGTIVLFGKQAELDSQIESARRAYDLAVSEGELQQSELAPYNDSNNISSPQYYLLKMNIGLSGDERWSGRDRLINGNRRNTSVNNQTYKSIVSVIPTKTKLELENEYRQQYALLEAAKSGNAKITQSVSVRICVPNVEESVINLLAQEIDRPVLSEREKRLLEMLDGGQNGTILQMKDTFSSEDIKVCPFCFQPITEEYRSSLLASIEIVLSKKVEEHIERLKETKLESIDIDFSHFEKLDSTILSRCIAALNELNEAISIINTAIDNKIENPYQPIILRKLGIGEIQKKLQAALQDLEKARQEYNAPLDNIPGIQNTLRALNNGIAYYEIKEYYETYLIQEELKKASEAILQEKVAIVVKTKKELDDLEAQRRSIKIAIEMINAGLRYVFFSKKRLEIEANQDSTQYTLKSNGVSVKPSNISVGERNILALCYFFVEMLDKMDADKAFTTELFVVIDDPISSFDHENKVGMMSLLRRNLEKIICGNPNSKVLVLTHDLQSAFDLKKATEEICSITKNRKQGECTFVLYELENRKITRFNAENRNEYSRLLTTIYKYGLSAPSEIEPIIGNVMRRVLEAYATFMYRKGIVDISTSAEVLDALEDERYKDYFGNLMYRLVLHGESHNEERIRSMVDDVDFLEMLSDTEKQRTARDIICFLWLLNKPHIIAHLNKNSINGYEETIDEWCNDIIDFA